MADSTQEPARYDVLFDGACPVCRGAVERLRAWDRDEVLEFVPAQAPDLLERFPFISRDALSESIHLVGRDGETWEGAGAVEKLVRVLPGWSWAAWAFRLPMARPVAGIVYRWIARNRYQLRCRDHCPGAEGPFRT